MNIPNDLQKVLENGLVEAEKQKAIADEKLSRDRRLLLLLLYLHDSVFSAYSFVDGYRDDFNSLATDLGYVVLYDDEKDNYCLKKKGL